MSTQAFHPLIEEVVATMGPTARTLEQHEANALLAAMSELPDMDLGHAVESLERLAGYCHQHLGRVDLASQLLDLCYDTAPMLALAAERLNDVRLERIKERRRQFDSMTGASDAARARAPMVGQRAQHTVEALRPKTKFL